MLRYFALLALVAVASAEAHQFFKSKCPMVPGKYPFDLEKFKGDWLLSFANDLVLEHKKCAKINFPAYKDDKEKENGVLNSRITGISQDNTPVAYEIFFQPMLTENLGNLYSAVRKEGSSTYSSVMKTSIVSTDYTNYAVIIYCKNDFDSEKKAFGRKLFAEIWTRDGVTLAKDTSDALITMLSSYDVEAASIKPVQAKC